MRTTMDIPDELYRSLKARAAMEGKAVREVAINLFSAWVNDPSSIESQPSPAGRDEAREAWLARWQALGEAIKAQDADPRSAVEILLDDRR